MRHLIISALLLLLASVSSSTETAYEILQEYGFPIGLLPQGVQSYEFNSTSGEFKAFFNKTCSYSVDSYTLEYKKQISGKLTVNKLSKLSGVKVKVFLFWLSIVEVTRDDEELEFSVGIASANFPTDGFDECPQCGCGFDCDSIRNKPILDRVEPFVL